MITSISLTILVRHFKNKSNAQFNEEFCLIRCQNISKNAKFSAILSRASEFCFKSLVLNFRKILGSCNLSSEVGIRVFLLHLWWICGTPVLQLHISWFVIMLRCCKIYRFDLIDF